MSEQPASRPYTDERLRAAANEAAKIAGRVGPMHVAWDSISDAGALLAGEQTLARGTREDLLRQLTDYLEGLVSQ